MKKVIQIVLDNYGNLIDKTYAPIIDNSNYSYILQVISPVLSTSSVDVSVSTYSNITEHKTIRLRLAKSGDLYLKGSDVVDSRRTYYDIVKDYNVWEREIQGTIFSLLSKTNSTKAILSVTINEAVLDPNATNYLGTFGNVGETVVDIPLPTTENVGDYYVCNSLEYYSTNLGINFKYKDIVFYDGIKWVKGLAFRFNHSTPSIYITIEPSVLATYVDVEPTLTQDIVDSISLLDGYVKTNQTNITNNTNDITTLQVEVTGKEDRLPTKLLEDAGKYVKINSTGDGYVYEDVPISTEEFQEDIANINQELDTKSDIGHLHDDRYELLFTKNTAFNKNFTEATYTDTETGLVVNENNGISEIIPRSDHIHDDRYYTETEIDTKLSDIANASHTHDDRYYTETETNTLLSNKSDTGHTHIESDITNLDKYTKLEVDTKLSNKSDTGHTHNYIPTSEKGAINGVAELDSIGKIPTSQLPSYVDDVLEYASLSNFPTTGETGKIYITLDTNITYRWSGTTYVEIGSSLALGETSSTAYRGDRGKIAYDHSQTSHDYASSTHIHTKSEITDFPTSMPASDVYTWAKASTKPSYIYSEIGSTPTTLSGYGITDGVINTDSRLSDARPASDVYAWAKTSTKPSYSWTEITSKPTILEQTIGYGTGGVGMSTSNINIFKIGSLCMVNLNFLPTLSSSSWQIIGTLPAGFESGADTYVNTKGDDYGILTNDIATIRISYDKIEGINLVSNTWYNVTISYTSLM